MAQNPNGGLRKLIYSVVRKWICAEEADRPEDLKYAGMNKTRTTEDKHEQILKVYTGASVLSIATEMGINDRQYIIRNLQLILSFLKNWKKN